MSEEEIELHGVDDFGLKPRVAIVYSDQNPQGYRQLPRGVLYKYILGSAFAASFVEFLIFFAITVIWFVLFEFAIVPKYSSLFPISSLYQGTLFFVITFVSTLFIINQQNLYQDLVRLYERVLGNTVTLASEVCFALVTNNPETPVLKYFVYEKAGELPTLNDNTPVKQVYRDLNEILRGVVLAQRFEFRSQNDRRPSQARDTTHPAGLDRGTLISGLDIDRLPMQQYLKNELRRYQYNKNSTGGLADAMWDMVYRRVRVMGVLQKPPQLLYKHLMQTMDRQMSFITTDTADITGIKSLRVQSIVIYFLAAAVYVFCFSIAWQLYGDYGLAGLITAVPVVWFVLALFRTGMKLTDPFASWNTSHYVWIDLTRKAVNAAQDIDERFDRLFEGMDWSDRARPERVRRVRVPAAETHGGIGYDFLDVF